MHNFKELKVWKMSIELTKLVFELTRSFPNEHKFGLSNQLFRCAVSIPSNIAEGYGRSSTLSYMNFIKISRGSLYELETQLILAKRLNFIANDTLYDSIISLIAEEGKMINTLLNKLKSK